MAKKDTGKKKKDPEAAKKQPSRGDAVRAAAAQAIEATAGQAGFTRERAQQIADELVHAAGRFRETLEELRPVGSDELVTLREQVEALEARVAKLEATRTATRRRTTPAKRRARRRPPPERRARVAGRRVLITGVANPFGARLAQRLAADADVERVVGVDTRPVEPELAERIDVVAADLRSAELPPLVRAAAVDTVVHNDIVQFPEPGRPRAALHDVNVIGTLQLLTVCGGLPTLRAIVVRGSAAIYGSEPAAPAFFTEDDADRFPLRTRFQRDIGELERLVGAFARRHPAVAVHGAAAAARRRARLRHAGQPPPARAGRPHRARLRPARAGARRRRCGRRAAPGGAASRARAGQRRRRRRRLALARPAPRPPPGAADRRRRCGGRWWARRAARSASRALPDEVARYLRYGRGVDTTRMRRELRFGPQHSTLEALRARRGGRMTEDDWGFDADFARTRGAAARRALHALVARARRRRRPRPRRPGPRSSSPTRPAASRGTRRCSPPPCAATRCAATTRARFLVHGRAFELPWASTALRRLGGVPASAGNAERLLAEGHVVMTFPEGGRGTRPGLRAALPPRAPRARRLRRARAAQRRADRALRPGRRRARGRRPRAGARGAAAAPAACPLPVLPAPARWRIAFGEPLDVAHHGPEAAEDRALVLELGEEVLARVQEKVYDSLVNREGAL